MKSFTDEERKLLQTSVQFVPDVCAPIHVTAIIRHGTRFPSAKVIASMSRLLDKLKVNVPNITDPAIIKLITEASVPFLLKDADKLADMGRVEMKDMGQRFGNRWINLLDGSSESEIALSSTHWKRTQESAQTFWEGLKSVADWKGMKDPTIVQRNDLIRFYDSCVYYQERVVHNKTAMVEYEHFKTSPEMEDVVTEIESKLGGAPLTFGKFLIFSK